MSEENVLSENVLLVDDHNQVLGSVSRAEMRAEALCHRATFIFLFNNKGQLLVQERALSKDIYPGYFDPATGGVVAENETYDQAAYRELSEELGVSGVKLEPHFHFYFHNDNCKVWGRVYSCFYEGAVTLQKEEVASLVFETPEDILANKYDRNYSPSSMVALERMMQMKRIQ